MFDPKTNKFPYSEFTDVHYLKNKKDNGTIYDKNYPYIDESFGFKFKQFWVRCFFATIAIPVIYIRTGLKVEGRKNLKKYKDVLSKGAISVSNHIHMWDYMGIMANLFPRKTNVLVWDKNISGENSFLIRMSGGIPVPTNDTNAFIKMAFSTINLLKKGGWLHVMPEASMWEYYAPIRPFKDGAAFFAYKSNKPVVPMAYSYRPVKGIRKYVFHQIATLTLHIGEPIFPDLTLPYQESINKLTIQLHETVCELAGFKKGENIYPPVFNEKSKRRIDYYTKEYGVGYKSSW